MPAAGEGGWQSKKGRSATGLLTPRLRCWLRAVAGRLSAPPHTHTHTIDNAFFPPRSTPIPTRLALPSAHSASCRPLPPPLLPDPFAR